MSDLWHDAGVLCYIPRPLCSSHSFQCSVLSAIFFSRGSVPARCAVAFYWDAHPNPDTTETTRAFRLSRAVLLHRYGLSHCKERWRFVIAGSEDSWIQAGFLRQQSLEFICLWSDAPSLDCQPRSPLNFHSPKDSVLRTHTARRCQARTKFAP